MDQAVAAPSAQAPSAQLEALSFTGKAGEYFRIWIVNICLTVVTLGIYSPWAKVRTNKYLYRNTHLAGGSFDYLASPVAILKGRLVAFAMLVLYSVTSVVAPVFSLLVLLVISLAVPWLLVRSRMFAMRNTSYRNVRFRFNPCYGEAFKVIIGFTIIVVLSLGLAYAWARFRRAKMIVENTSYGTLAARLSEKVSWGDFFGVYFMAGILFAFAAAALVFLSGSFGSPEGATASTGFGLAVLLPAAFGVLYLMTYFGIDAAITRLILEDLHFDEHALRCNWSITRIVFIQFTNLVAILLSVGLLIPWATIRIRRYKLENLAAEVQGDLASVAAGQAEEVSALGDEIGEAFDFDMGL